MTTINQKTTTATKTVTKATEVVGVFRKHGEMAVKYWNEADRSNGLGDCYAALAIAEYAQEHDKIIAQVFARKLDEKKNKVLMGNVSFNLSDITAARESVKVSKVPAIKQDGAPAINKAIMATVFGMRDINPPQMAIMKTRFSRAYPAAMALLFRASELNVKLADVVTVDEQTGKVNIASCIAQRVPTKTIEVDGKKVPGITAEQQVKSSKPVVLSVNDMAKKADEWKVTSKAKIGARTPDAVADTKTSEQKAAEAKALAKTGFMSSAQSLGIRLNNIIGQVPNVPALSDEENHALMVLLEIVGKYQSHISAKVRMDASPEVKAKPAAKRKAG